MSGYEKDVPGLRSGVLTAHSLEELDAKIDMVRSLGWISLGDTKSYYANTLGRRIYYQVVASQVATEPVPQAQPQPTLQEAVDRIWSDMNNRRTQYWRSADYRDTAAQPA